MGSCLLFPAPAYTLLTACACGLPCLVSTRLSTADQSMLEKNASMYFGRSAGL